MTVKFLIVYSSAYLSTDRHIRHLQTKVYIDLLSFLTCFICHPFSYLFSFFKLFRFRVFDCRLALLATEAGSGATPE